MNTKQFNIIVANYFPKLGEKTIGGAHDVLVNDLTAYAAEDKHKAPRGTVARYANKIQAAYDLAQEIVSHE